MNEFLIWLALATMNVIGLGNYFFLDIFLICDTEVDVGGIEPTAAESVE